MRRNQHLDLTPAHALHQAIEYRVNIRQSSEEELCQQRIDNAIELVAWVVVFGCLLTVCILAWAMGKGLI